MDMVTTFDQVNWLGVLAASVVAFFGLGGLWYGPLLGRQWMAEFGFEESDLAQRPIGRIFSLAWVLSFVAALMLAMFIGPGVNWQTGAAAGFAAGIGWVATLLGVLYLFEQRSVKLFLINAGYCVLALTLTGLILGLFN